jgi:5-oxopent-3-ene-1,2,5-tricarboxylate decarboxylase/2-hydroxyhepta-2,4-diene-1,7-dioate isomerase
LHPGDLILTGTPAGAMDSLIHPGDEVVLEIEGIGRLTNPVIADQREEE